MVNFSIVLCWACQCSKETKKHDMPLLTSSIHMIKCLGAERPMQNKQNRAKPSLAKTQGDFCKAVCISLLQNCRFKPDSLSCAGLVRTGCGSYQRRCDRPSRLQTVEEPRQWGSRQARRSRKLLPTSAWLRYRRLGPEGSPAAAAAWQFPPHLQAPPGLCRTFCGKLLDTKHMAKHTKVPPSAHQPWRIRLVVRLLKHC